MSKYFKYLLHLLEIIEEFLSLIKVTTLNLIIWSLLSSSRRTGDGVKRLDVVIVILASWKDHFIRVGENMVQHPSNYLSITVIYELRRCETNSCFKN